jgi:3-oxoacyl-[acyl-carrier-protein] synthase III
MTSAVGFLGFGSYLPPTIRDNSFWTDAFRPDDDERRRESITDVERSASGKSVVVPPEIRAAMESFRGDPFRGARLRHVIADDAEVSDMEAEAARRALIAANVDPGEIDVVLVNSLVPDRITPSNAPAVQAKVGLHNASAWSLDVTCASFQPQLVTAAALIRSGAANKVLMVFSSAATRLMDNTSAMSPAFGDAASAVVIGSVPAGFGLLGHWMRTDGTLREGVVTAPLVDGCPQKRWDLPSGPMRLTAFDLEVGKQAGLLGPEFCRDACTHALVEARVKLSDVKLFIVNQSVGWFPDACRRKLELPEHTAFDTFAEVANIGAAAVPFNLARAAKAGRVKNGDIVLIYSPGAGFTRAAAVCAWFER